MRRLQRRPAPLHHAIDVDARARRSASSSAAPCSRHTVTRTLPLSATARLQLAGRVTSLRRPPAAGRPAAASRSRCAADQRVTVSTGAGATGLLQPPQPIPARGRVGARRAAGVSSARANAAPGVALPLDHVGDGVDADRATELLGLAAAVEREVGPQAAQRLGLVDDDAVPTPPASWSAWRRRGWCRGTAWCATAAAQRLDVADLRRHRR